MAFKKEIELENGIIVNYHRIVSINKITNSSNIIELASYISEKERKKEEKYQSLQLKAASGTLDNTEKEELNKGINVFIKTDYIQSEYNEKITIEDTYKYLRTLDKFKDAIDI